MADKEKPTPILTIHRVTTTIHSEKPAGEQNYQNAIAKVLKRKEEPFLHPFYTASEDRLSVRGADLMAQRVEAERRLKESMRVPSDMLGGPFHVGGTLTGRSTEVGGVRVAVSAEATEHDGWNWKSSRHRSPRVLKKLLKRFGSRERRKPSAYFVDVPWNRTLICHPDIYAQIVTKLKEGRLP